MEFVIRRYVKSCLKWLTLILTNVYLRVCRVSELSKEQNKAIEATESINAVQIRSMKVNQRKAQDKKYLLWNKTRKEKMSGIWQRMHHLSQAQSWHLCLQNQTNGFNFAP